MFLFSILLVSGLTLVTTERTKCYFCTSATEPRCNDTNLYYNNGYIEATECSIEKIDTTLSRIQPKITQWSDSLQPDTESFDCIKIEKYVYNNKTIIRGCQTRQLKHQDHCSQIQSLITDSSTIGYCGVCKTDGCNSSSKIHMKFELIIPVALLPLLWVLYIRC